MATVLQLRRGTTANHAAFIGRLGEVTMDTTKKTLVVHDGVTPGGFPLFLSKDYTGVFNTRAYTAPVAVPYHLTDMTVNAALSNVFYMGVLTGNATGLTITNPVDGQTINLRYQQDVTGNRTVTLPASVKASGTIAREALRASWLVLTYVAAVSRWEGAWSPVPL